MNNEIKHYGTPRHSGRYPWGSGNDPQRSRSFLQEVEELKKKGLSEKQIADGFKMTTSQLRNKKSILRVEQRNADIAQATRLKDKGYSNVEIGKRMGRNESSVRALLDPVLKERSDSTKVTADILRDSVKKKGYIDVGVGVERHIGVSRTKLKVAMEMLKDEGYLTTYMKVEQLGTGKKTTVMVLSKPKKEALEVVRLKNKGLSESEIAKETGLHKDKVNELLKKSFADVYKNKDNVRTITDYSEDGGETFRSIEPIKSVSSNRVHIRYHEDGGSDKDGVIELRPGVDDISLGNAKYAQVRIGVDGTHYLKGMAMYSDDIPKGFDIVYNTNKTKDNPKEKVFKEMKDDPDNPFGATVRQKHYVDAKGKEHLSSLNIVNEEGDWGKWSKNISSQVLSKQTPALAKKQLGLAYDLKKQEFDEIMALTNPTIKKKLLESFADDADSSAVHLKAAALPRQGSHVILPFPNMKETEVYAPNYRNGEQVVLIRYPHGGIFEIPQLTVNNKNPEAKKVLSDKKGTAIDAIGIHPKVAERLSGADFDGDTVLVIPNNGPNNKGLIKTAPRLEGLIGFDPKTAYPAYEGMPKISPRTKQMKMGDVSNLITDMTIRGANPRGEEIARAVRHSMVVIDSEKHNLNYKQSYIDNGIAALKKKYQGTSRSGASTLISRASSQKRVPHREEGKKVLDPKTGKTKRLYVDSKTGKKLYEYTDETYTNKSGKIIKRTMSSTKMAEADDAFTLSSGTPMETIYANHANRLKALANEARKSAINAEHIPYSATAKKTYTKEVDVLNSKLNTALKNAPLERQALMIANRIVATKRAANPDMDNDEIKKIKGQALAVARSRVGAKKTMVEITDREWEAIQAGAVSKTTLLQILNNTDLDRVKELATPRSNKSLSTAKVSRAKLLLSAGHTVAEVADDLGVSTNVISKLID